MKRPTFAIMLLVMAMLTSSLLSVQAAIAVEIGVAVKTVELRRALLINAGATAGDGKIEQLAVALKTKGFVVTRLKNASREGWGKYETYLRGIPEAGVSVIYYQGPVDAVMQTNKRIGFRMHLGGVKKMPTASAPPGPRDNRKLPDPPHALDISTIKDRLGNNAARQNVVVFDITTIIDKAKDPKQDMRKLTANLTHTIKLMAGPRTFSFINKPGESLLVNRVAKLLEDGNAFNDKPDVGGFGTPKEGSFSLRHEAGSVVGHGNQLIEGKKAGDHWIDPNGMVFVWCPAGQFVMGDKRFSDAQPTQVRISKGFWIGKYELTRASARLMRLQASSHFGREVNLPFYGPDCSGAADALKYWRKHLKSVGLNVPGWSYDIPTEAEWEYAARAGNSKFDAGDAKAVAVYGNFADRSLYEKPRDTHFVYADRQADDGYGHELAPIGSYKPNAWGIHDMLGNVAEHVCTQYTESLVGGVDPNILESKDGRSMPRYVIRGGAWCSPWNYLHPSHRSIMANAGTLTPYSGVRLIIRQGPPRALSHTDLRNMAKAASNK
jgi:formylglycine-generating enzyme required for sulfatase activity